MCYIANHNYRLIYFNLPLKNLTLKIPPSSTISVFSCAREFSEYFFADNGKLMCRHSINFHIKTQLLLI